jgi:hypothetical protein
MKSSHRRTFMIQAAAAVGATVLTTGRAMAQAKLEESDPQAVGLGYKHDSTKVDQAKYPKHEASQKCNNCQLFQGKAADAWGPCPLFGTKQVNAQGWCSAWVKKPA